MITHNLAERLCQEAARRDDTRIARRLNRKQVIGGVYRLDEGAVMDEFFPFLEEVGALERMAQVRGKALEREMIPWVRYILFYGCKTLFGIKSLHALPEQLFSDEALMRLVGFNAHQVQHGARQRGRPSAKGPARKGSSVQRPWPTTW
jgi:hypothetical protein